MKSSTIIIFVLAIVCSIDIRQAVPDTVAARKPKLVSNVGKGITEIAIYYKNKATDAKIKLNQLKSKRLGAMILLVNSELENVKKFRRNGRVHVDKCIEALEEMKKEMPLRLERVIENARHVIGEQDPLTSTIKAGNDLLKLLYSPDLLNPSKNGDRKPSEVIEDLKSKVKEFQKSVDSKKAAIDEACSDVILNVSKQANAFLKSLQTSSKDIEVANCHLLPSDRNLKVNNAHNFRG